MKESMRKEIMSMNLSELNDLGDFIRDVKVINAKSTLKVGMEVYVVQKTKRELVTITKIITYNFANKIITNHKN